MASGSGQDGHRLQSSGNPTPGPRAARRPRDRACVLQDERNRVARLLEEENRFRAEGFRAMAGVDEVGRGCLAGPVYAGAVVLGDALVLGLDDSKVLPSEVRSELAARIQRTAQGAAVGTATPAEIDALGILPATLLAMRRALQELLRGGLEADLVLLDAVRLPGLGTAQRSYVRGDARLAAIAAASIIAKVARDRLMEDLHASYPYYGFDHHKGYATREHLAALRRHGPSPVHRLSFDRVLPCAGQARAA